MAYLNFLISLKIYKKIEYKDGFKLHYDKNARYKRVYAKVKS